MSSGPSDSRGSRQLALLGVGITTLALGVSLVALAFTVHPVHASAGVFWACIVLGIGAAAVGTLLLLRRVRAQTGRKSPPAAPMLAAECRRVYDALTAFFSERAVQQPRPGRFTNGSERLRQWNEETLVRYRQELRPWAVRVFDEVLHYGGVPESARSLIEMPSNSQVAALREIFREAAEVLDRLPSR